MGAIQLRAFLQFRSHVGATGKAVETPNQFLTILGTKSIKLLPTFGYKAFLLSEIGLRPLLDTKSKLTRRPERFWISWNLLSRGDEESLKVLLVDILF